MLYQGRYATKEVVFLLYLLRMLVGPRKGQIFKIYVLYTSNDKGRFKASNIIRKNILKRIENGNTFQKIHATKHEVFAIYSVSLFMFDKL